jgi:hypothetical protein
MLAVLGAGKVPVGRLELASAEMAAFIPPDKMNILQDIYTVTKEEERLRTTWPGPLFFTFAFKTSSSIFLCFKSAHNNDRPISPKLSVLFFQPGCPLFLSKSN